MEVDQPQQIDKNIFKEKTAMSSLELKEAASKLGIQYNVIDLSQLENFDEQQAFVHTGESPNQYNKGITNHWLAINGKYLFDSYGKYKVWQLPDWVEEVDTIPKAIQAYDTNVCGQYCLAYLAIANEAEDSDAGRELCEAFDFTKDRKENDTKILQWYNGL